MGKKEKRYSSTVVDSMVANEARKGSDSCYALPWPDWRSAFGERERRLIENCQVYAQNDPAGMPGHALALIVSQFADILDQDRAKSRKLSDQ